MSANPNVNLTLTLQDRASRPLQQALQNVQRAQAAAASKNRQLVSDRARLGMRSEREIQAEILRTQRAYNNLARSGRSSQNDLARASQATRTRIRELNSELGRTERLTAGQKLKNFGSGVMQAGVAAKAGSMVLASPVKKVLDYDKSLRDMTNISHGGGGISKEEWYAGMQETDSQVKKIVKDIGASKEQTLEAINTSFAQGFTPQQSYAMAPTTLKAAIGGNAESGHVTLLARSGMDFMKKNGEDANPDNAGWMLDMAMRSSQLGAYEMSDMAANFPNFLTQVKGSYRGKGDYASLLTAFQTLMKSSGSVENTNTQWGSLQSEMYSKRSQKAFEDRGINLSKSMSESKRLNGTSAHESYINLLKGQIDKDPEVKAAIARTNKDPAKRTDEENASIDMAKRKALMPFLRNQYSVSAALGMLNEKEYYDQQKKELVGSYGGTVDTAYGRIAEGDAHKIQEGKNSLDRAQYEALKGFVAMLGDGTKALADYAAEYPELTKHMVGAGIALFTLAAAAAAASFSGRIFGSGALGGAGSIIGGAGGAVGGGTMALTASNVIIGGATSAAVGYQIGTAISDVLYRWQNAKSMEDRKKFDNDVKKVMEEKKIPLGAAQEFTASGYKDYDAYEAERKKMLTDAKNAGSPKDITAASRIMNDTLQNGGSYADYLKKVKVLKDGLGTKLRGSSRSYDPRIASENTLPESGLRGRIPSQAQKTKESYQSQISEHRAGTEQIGQASMSMIPQMMANAMTNNLQFGVPQFDVAAFQQLLDAVAHVNIPVQTDVTVNLTGLIDQNVLFRTQEKVTIKQLDRGAS